MAKKNATEIIQFRGIPITGDINTFLRVLEKKCNFMHFEIEEGTVTIDGYFVGVHTQSNVKFSLKSKTVFDVGVRLSNDDDKDLNYYKELYTSKYGKPETKSRDYHEVSVFKAPGGRIEIFESLGFTEIRYINETNEKLAKKEQMQMFLDEI